MEEKRNLRKERIGVVSSNKGDKTITVMVKWKEKHPIYGKFVNKTKKYHAHDEKNECSIGDTVRLMETRPMSKNKRWRLVQHWRYSKADGNSSVEQNQKMEISRNNRKS